MKIKWSLHLVTIIALFTVMITGCKKEEKLVLPPSLAHFTNRTSGTYFITAPGVTYKVPIGVTTVSDKPRTINISVSSPTGAVQGTHYTLGSTSVTIPAGQTIDSIEVRGVFSEYTTGRKDTLVFTLQSPDLSSSEYNGTFRLLMRGPCFEGDVDLNEFLGSYNNTNEVLGTSAYGPYATTISAVNLETATTGTITVTNIFDFGWNPITFKLDWTDPNNRTVTLDEQSGIGDASTAFGGAWAGEDISVRAFAGQNGTFSICGQTLTLKLQIGITGVGWSGSLYTVNMAR